MKTRHIIIIAGGVLAVVALTVNLSVVSAASNSISEYLKTRSALNYAASAFFAAVVVVIAFSFLNISSSISKLGAILNTHKSTFIKSGLSFFFFALLLILLLTNGGKVDTIGLCLSALVAIPWLSTLIVSARLPGGIEIVFKDITAAQKLVENIPVGLRVSKEKYAFLSILSLDPNIAMAALRIEMETRLRQIGKYYDRPEYEPLARLFRNLRSEEAITEQEFYGIEELIDVGNKAAHGAKVDLKVIQWATNYGPVVLSLLDRKLSELKKKAP
jgi:hypothetical protein